MTKWTPGPWQVGGFVDTDVVVPPRLVRLSDGSEAWAVSIVASVHNPATDDFSKAVQDKSDELTDPVVAANAHLIAAAPDLYDALEALYEANDRGANAMDRGDALANAREALAKARGEEEES